MRQLVLLGGGHAHVQVVRAFAAAVPSDAAVTLISATRLTPYSGMLPGLIAGHYTRAEAHIDLAALCEASGVRFIEQEVRALDVERKQLEAATGERHAYDILSLDTGSTTPLDRVPGAAAHAIAVKPVDRFLEGIERLQADLRHRPSTAVGLVGAGAAGIEVILALAHRFHTATPREHRLTLHLVTDSDTILAEFPRTVQRYAADALHARGIVVHTGARAAQVEAGSIDLDNGTRIPVDYALFVTGAAPAPMYERAGLRTDDRGFVLVDACLQSLSHPDVFACGDVATVPQHPRPKAGVFAVRQGPPLANNLRRALAGLPLAPFVPQRNYLVLLSTGRKHAIATRNGWALQGEWVWMLKDWIDRRFVGGFTPQRIRSGN